MRCFSLCILAVSTATLVLVGSASAAILTGGGEIDDTFTNLFAHYDGGSYDGTTWTDKSSGAGNDLSSSGGTKPTAVGAGTGSGQPNGQAYADFDGNARIYGGAADLTGGAFTVFAVARLDAKGGYIFDGTTSSQRAALLTDTGGVQAWHLFVGGGGTLSSTEQQLTDDVGSWRIHTMLVDGTNSYHAIDGSQNKVSQGNLTGAGTWQTVILGARYTQANFLDGGIADFLIYNTALSTSDISDVEGALGDKYAITIPEPSALVLAAMGLVGVLGLGWHRRRA